MVSFPVSLEGLTMGQHTFNYRVCYSEDPNAEGAEFSTTQSFKFDVPPQLGDVNADGKINAGDVAEMVNYLLGKPSSKFMIEVANINGDDVVDLADVIMIVNLIMVTE